jgi:hypothetical protein
MKLSARNQLRGRILALTVEGVMAEVAVEVVGLDVPHPERQPRAPLRELQAWIPDHLDDDLTRQRSTLDKRESELRKRAVDLFTFLRELYAMLPESRKSDSTGTGGLRCSISRLSWESAITGIFKSLARILSSRLISDTSG